MEKRILLAFILSFGVLYAFRAFYVPPATQPAEEAQQPASPPARPAPEPGTTEEAPTGSPPEKSTAGLEVRATKAEEMVVDTPLYNATVSNVGGVLKSYFLKAYTDADGRAIELIDSAGASKVGWPLAIVTGDAAVDELLAKAEFAIRHESERIEMEFAANGLHARKTVLFKPDNYEFEIRTSLSKDGKAVAHWVAWQGGFGDQSVSHDAATRNVVYQSAGTFERVNLGSMEEAQEVNSARAGVEDQYFLAMFLLPKDPALLKLRKQDYAAASGESVGTLYLAVPAEEAQALRVYVGPKDERWLRRTEPQLAGVIDYGFFEVIARPLIFALLWIHSYVGNFGWAIIILTVIINFLLFPLRLKQQISMQKMQKVQPQMRTLQDRYKKLKANDPKRAQIQAEMMNLYKEHGVNPMGGCLPLLLQMPFLFAFWSMLSVSIELRRAPWIAWWIDDLSRYDSTFILPILMTVSMIIMQKMTPTTVDPAQAKMMMIMPVILSVMFLWVQSGLMLYWLTSNVVGIGQQYFINKYWGSRAEARAVSRPARRELRAK